MAQAAPLFVGVDGGGSRCRVRVETAAGEVLALAEGGSANAFTDFEGALRTVESCIGTALDAAGLAPADAGRCRVGLALAGGNMPSVKARFAQAALPYAACRLVGDAIAGCLGAHGGRSGGVAIFGTGAAYVAHAEGRFTVFGGWGAAVSDQGSAADIGRAALSTALLAHDGVMAPGDLARAVLSRFAYDPAALAQFAAAAGPAEFGRFAPLVFDLADEGDGAAAAIVSRALRVIEPSLRRLSALGAVRIALLGSVAPRYRDRLAPELRERLVEPEGSALDGALVLARQ